MSLFLFGAKGTPLEAQTFTWRELVQRPISKLDDDAFTRVRVLLMSGVEREALRFSHACARARRDLRPELARLRCVEQRQAMALAWLVGADHSALETTIAQEQAAIEVTAAVAQKEPDPYLAQTYRFGLLDEVDHLYRFSALLDRVEGKDANNILQCYTDILPGRPTALQHRAPQDGLRDPLRRRDADPLSRLHALTVLAGEQLAHDYYLAVGPQFADPVARQLYAEIAAAEEQHVGQYESLLDPETPWLEDWLLHEANEAYLYYSCMKQETNPRIRALWQRFLDHELGQLQHVMGLFKEHERRDPAEVLPNKLPEPLPLASQRAFVRQTLAQEADLRAKGALYVAAGDEGEASRAFRERLNRDGSPSRTVAAGYRWSPGTELGRNVVGL